VSAFLLLFGKFKSVSKSILSRLKMGGVTALVIATALSSALSLSSCSKEERIICGHPIIQNTSSILKKKRLFFLSFCHLLYYSYFFIFGQGMSWLLE
jgi:hypothetical protein